MPQRPFPTLDLLKQRRGSQKYIGWLPLPIVAPAAALLPRWCGNRRRRGSSLRRPPRLPVAFNPSSRTRHQGRMLGFRLLAAALLMTTLPLPVVLPLSPSSSAPGSHAGHPDRREGCPPRVLHQVTPTEARLGALSALPPAAGRDSCAPASGLLDSQHGRGEVFHQFLIFVFQCNGK